MATFVAKKMKIFWLMTLVDDDWELRKILSEYLIVEGFDPSLSMTDQERVDGALSCDYTAMILDIHATGYERHRCLALGSKK